MNKRKLIKDPIYKQVSELIKEEIKSDDYNVGDKFLSERDISEQFEISRPTANKAISLLVNEGILELRKGLGAFIKKKEIVYDIQSLISFSDIARLSGHVPSSRVIVFEKINGTDLTPMVCSKLKIAGTNEVYHIIRLRFADDVPMIWEERYVNASLCPDLNREMAGKSLHHIFSETYNLTITGAYETIGAVGIDKKTSKLFGLNEGAPCLFISCQGILDSNTILWWEKTLYRGDRYQFHNVLGTVETTKPRREIIERLA